MEAIKVTLTGRVSDNIDNPIINVFGYKTNTPVNDDTEMFDFAAAFADSILIPLKAIIHESMSWDTLRYESGTGVYEFEYIYSPAVSANVSGERMPLFNAWAFQYKRASTGARSGAKRFGPMSESGTAAGAPGGALVGALNTVAVALGATLSGTGISDHTPVILHDNGDGTFGYRDTAGVIYKRVTSQNSRKR